MLLDQVDHILVIQRVTLQGLWCSNLYSPLYILYFSNDSVRGKYFWPECVIWWFQMLHYPLLYYFTAQGHCWELGVLHYYLLETWFVTFFSEQQMFLHLCCCVCRCISMLSCLWCLYSITAAFLYFVLVICIGSVFPFLYFSHFVVLHTICVDKCFLHLIRFCLSCQELSWPVCSLPLKLKTQRCRQ